MLNPRLAIALSIGLSIVIDATMLVLIHQAIEESSPRRIAPLLPTWAWLVLPLVLSQLGLVAMWVVWGRGPGLLRFLLALGVTCLLANRIAHAGLKQADIYFILFAFLAICLVVANLFLLTGWRLFCVTDMAAADTFQASKAQFSIRYLFMITTVAAILFGVARGVLGEANLQNLPALAGTLGRMMMPIAQASVPVPIMMWGLLAVRNVWTRVLLSGLFSADVILALSTLSWVVYHQWLSVMPIAVHLGVLCAAFLALRAAGYRLGRAADQLKQRR